MLTMKPVRAEIKSLCDKFNVMYEENLLGYIANDSEECIGVGFFVIEQGAVDIKSIVLTNGVDEPLRDGIKRAILNFASLEGAYLYTIDGGSEESIVEFFSQGCKKTI